MDFVNWLPVAVALALTLVISLILAASLVDLKAATDARKQSNEILAVGENLAGRALRDSTRRCEGILTGQQGARDLAKTGLFNARSCPQPAHHPLWPAIPFQKARLGAQSRQSGF